VKEDSFKVLILFLSFTGILLSSNMVNNEYEYMSIDFVPYSTSKTSIGINLYENSYSNYEFNVHNWFSDNLCFSGSFRPILIEDDMYLKHNLAIKYSSDFKSKIFKSLVLGLNYQKIKYKDDINYNYKGILYFLLASIKIKSIWILPSYGKVDDQHKTNQYGFSILKSFNNKWLFTFGVNGYLNNDIDVAVPYISLRYSI